MVVLRVETVPVPASLTLRLHGTASTYWIGV